MKHRKSRINEQNVNDTNHLTRQNSTTRVDLLHFIFIAVSPQMLSKLTDQEIELQMYF